MTPSVLLLEGMSRRDRLAFNHAVQAVAKVAAENPRTVRTDQARAGFATAFDVIHSAHIRGANVEIGKPLPPSFAYVFRGAREAARQVMLPKLAGPTDFRADHAAD